MVQILTAKYGDLKDKRLNYKKAKVENKKHYLVLNYMALEYNLK